MIDIAHAMSTLIASFTASLVECVEALTVVLAVGSVRGWKSALGGATGALVTLLALVLLLGRSLASIPLPALQLGIGILLLLFGLRWLRKAILRAAGAIPLHDETVAFAQASASLRRDMPPPRGGIDKLAFATAYKIVMVEGIEVIFIVIALGSGAGLLAPASIGAVAALGCVVLLGLILHRPLSRIPENTLKFAVGILLSAFGTFWAGEGIGLIWPAKDGALLELLAAYLCTGCVAVLVFRGRTSRAATARSTATRPMRQVAARISGQLMSMFVDDGWLALGTVTWVAVSAFAVRALLMTARWNALVFTAGLLAMLAFSGARGARVDNSSRHE